MYLYVSVADCKTFQAKVHRLKIPLFTLAQDVICKYFLMKHPLLVTPLRDNTMHHNINEANGSCVTANHITLQYFKAILQDSHEF